MLLCRYLSPNDKIKGLRDIFKLVYVDFRYNPDLTEKYLHKCQSSSTFFNDIWNCDTALPCIKGNPGLSIVQFCLELTNCWLRHVFCSKVFHLNSLCCFCFFSVLGSSVVCSEKCSQNFIFFLSLTLFFLNNLHILF